MIISRIKNYFERSSLNKIFGAVLFLASGLPLLLTSFLIYSNYQHEKQLTENLHTSIAADAQDKLSSILNELRSSLKIASQDQNVVDILLTQGDLRALIENRTYGRLNEIRKDSQIDIDWALYSSMPFELIASSSKFSFPKEIKLSNAKIFLENQDIYLSEKIMLDDQNLSGANAIPRGVIISKIKFQNLKEVIPKLKRIISIKEIAGREKVELEIEAVNVFNYKILITFILMIIFLTTSVALGLYLLRRKILIPLRNISLKLKGSSVDPNKNEIILLEKTIESYVTNLKTQEVERGEKLKLQAANLLASQVAHDIRSPLTALNMIVSTIEKLPEDKRLIVRHAIQRINDIANNLLAKGQKNNLENEYGNHPNDTHLQETSTITMISSLIDGLVSEKRTQYRDKINIHINIELSRSYGLFCKIPQNEFKRILSNCINNSVEALINESGIILVNLDYFNNMARIEIMDNGKGIPPEIIGKLGEIGVTHGKEGSKSGSGLGLHHAKSVIEASNGTIDFESNIDNPNRRFSSFPANSTVTILIPKADSPEWFIDKIILSKKCKLITLDDDQSIHNVWQGRLASLKASEHEIQLICFSSSLEFKKWVSAQSDFLNTIFLVDYELVGQDVNGLDIIEELSLEENSILVSSRYEEEYIVERCKRLKMKMIPKSMAGLVPITVKSSNIDFNTILIDDDELVRMTWDLKSNSRGISFKSFSSPNEVDFSLINKDTLIYIDSNLAANVKGEEIAQKLYSSGFKNIYLTTGHSAENFKHLTFLKGVINKTPPW